MNSVVYELSPLQKAIWFEHIHKKAHNFGQSQYTQEKNINSLKCVSYSASTSISHVLLNCLEAAPLLHLHVSSGTSSLYDYNGAQFLGRSVQIGVGINYRLSDFQ